MAKITDKIHDRIEEVKPKPKWEFAFRTVSKEVLLVLAWIILVLILGAVIYFVIHDNPWAFIPLRHSFFWLGLVALPWELSILITGGVLLMYFLARHIGTLYRMSTPILVIIILGSLAIGYGGAELTGLNRHVAHVSFVGALYRHHGQIVRHPLRGTRIEGTVQSITPSEIKLQDREQHDWQVELNDQTKYPQGYNFQNGEEVRINGIKQQPFVIKAFAVQPDEADDIRSRASIRPHLPSMPPIPPANVPVPF